MTVVVLGVGVVTRKPKWNQLLFPIEIPAARFSCLSSGSFRPRLGLCILLLLLVACLAFIVVPFLSRSPSVFYYLTGQRTSLKMSSPAAVDTTSSADVRFSADLYKHLAEPSENMVMSSLSVSSVLAMLLAGARGATALQIEKSLYQKSEDVMEGYSGIMRALEALRQDTNVTLRAANKIYPEATFDVIPEYKSVVEKRFLATIESLDFKNDAEKSRMSINGWVEDQTNKKITELLARDSVNRDTIMVLVNAIYFKGDWKSKFLKEDTQKVDFHVDSSKTIQVDMMYRSGKYAFRTLQELGGATALRMPYKGDALDMVFILPSKGDTLASLEEKLPSVDFSKIKFGGETKVLVLIPKFKVESMHDLTQTLTAIGMTDLFSNDADLSGISSGKDLYVSMVVQKAFIEVNEEGAEAAAATAAVVMYRGATREVEFYCNRPFYFYIQERSSGVILFSGKVVNPNQK